MNLLTALGIGISVFTAAAVIIMRIPHNAAMGLMGAASMLLGLGYTLAGSRGSAVFHSGMAAYFLRLWWTGGGGSNTRRRLRNLRGRFAGVRRTAPPTT